MCRSLSSVQLHNFQLYVYLCMLRYFQILMCATLRVSLAYSMHNSRQFRNLREE